MNWKARLGLIGCVALLACADEPPAAEPAKASADSRQAAGGSVLLIQTSPTAIYDGTRLTLANVSATHYFADRPGRAVGLIATAAFVKEWSKDTDNLDGDPPNAGITFIENGVQSTATVELLDPAMSGADLSYGVNILSGKLPATMTLVSVFIDGFCESCIIGG